MSPQGTAVKLASVSQVLQVAMNAYVVEAQVFLQALSYVAWVCLDQCINFIIIPFYEPP